MKKIYLLCFVFLALYWQVGAASAQTSPASATWPLTNPGSGGTGDAVTTAGQIQGSKERLKNLEVNLYSGAGSSQRLRIVGNAWPASQTDTIAGTYVQFAVTPSSSSKGEVADANFRLGQNYPNPMSYATTIPYELKRGGYVTLEVFDAMGKKVTILVNDRQPAGAYEVEVRTALKSGLYFYTLTADGMSTTRRMVVVK